MDPKKLFLEHGEKIGLGVGVVLLLVYVVLAWVVPPSNADIQQIDNYRNAISTALANNTPAAIPSTDYLKGARQPWEVVEKPGDANDWAMVYQTRIIEEPSGPTKPVDTGPQETVHKAPTLLDPHVDIGAITLKWSKDKDTTATIARYKVLRKLEGAGDFKELGTPIEEPKDEASYVDSEVQPKKSYVYKVVSLTEDKKPDKKEMVSNEVKATATSTVAVVFKGGSAQEQNKIAIITVRKFFPDTKEWKKKDFTVRPGEAIGKKETTKTGGKVAEVDFTTGYKLIDVKEAKRKVKRQVTRMEKKDNVMVPVVEDIEDVQTSLKMVYSDEEAKQVEQWSEVGEAAPAGPKPKDGK